MSNDTTEATTSTNKTKRTYTRRTLGERLSGFSNQELEAFLRERTADVLAAAEVVKNRAAEQAKLEKLASQSVKAVEEVSAQA